MMLESIKRWWRKHRWVNTVNNYVFPRSTTLFWLTENEEEEAKKFKEKNKAIFYQYCFTPGPIGACKHIKCTNHDGESCDSDITDYGAW